MAAEISGGGKRESQVSAALTRLNGLVNGLRPCIDALGGKLCDVLRDAPTAEPSPEREKATLVSLAEQIDANSNILQENIAELRSIIDRLEI